MENTSTTQAPEKERTKMGSLVVGAVGVFSAIYILNPTFGVDFIPDNIPIVGNLDEAAAVALLVSCLNYFGVDLKNLFGVDLGGIFGRKDDETPETRQAKGKVVDD